MKNILLIKTSALGDIIQAYPVVDFLREKFPEATIDWAVETPFAELVEAHPKIDNVLYVSTKTWRRNFFKLSTFKDICKVRKELRRKTYDAVFDLQGNIKSGLILSQVKSPQKIGFGKHSVPEWPNLLFTQQRFNPPIGGNIREDYLAIVKAFFQDCEPHKSSGVTLKITDAQKTVVQSILQHPILNENLKVIVSPGSAWRNKQMTPEALALFLSEVQLYLKCKFIFLWGTQVEKTISDQLHQQFIKDSIVPDRMSLPMVQNLMMGADLVIGMDSLPLHLAGTTTTTSFSVFGPSLAHKYKPIGKNHFAFQGHCPYGRTFEKRCPILRTCPTGACIRELSGGTELFTKFRDWWNKEIG